MSNESNRVVLSERALVVRAEAEIAPLVAEAVRSGAPVAAEVLGVKVTVFKSGHTAPPVSDIVREARRYGVPA